MSILKTNKEVIRMCAIVKNGGKLKIEDYDKYQDDLVAIHLINEAKKEWKRSKEYKKTMVPRSLKTRKEVRDIFKESSKKNVKI